MHVCMCFDQLGKRSQEGDDVPASRERTMGTGEQGRKGRPAFHYRLVCTWAPDVMLLKVIADPHEFSCI